jgi:hypothetical protein
MASTTDPIGQAEECDIEVYEGDTEDFVVTLNDVSGTAAAVEDWTATLVISDVKGGPGTAAGVNTYTGTAPSVSALGQIAIDMNLFDLPVANYKYQIRTVDTVTPDTPGKTRFFGGFKVLARSI